MTKQNLCHSCDKKTYNAVLSCDSCNHWFCPDCHKLSKETIKVLENNDSKFVKWFCGSCGPKITDMMSLSSKLDDVLTRVDKISSAKSTSTATTTSESKMSYSEATSNNITKKISKIVHNSITNHSNYVADLEKRSVCHILHGVPDESDPSLFVNELFKTTLQTEIIPSNCTRLGKINPSYSTSKRIIRITYSSLSDKELIISKLNLLKSSPHFRVIRFSDDLNSEQRKELKEARELATTRNTQENDVNVKHVVRGSPSKNLRVVRLILQT